MGGPAACRAVSLSVSSDPHPYQRDYLRIIGGLTVFGALLFALTISVITLRRGMVLTEVRALAAAAVLLALITGGAALARALLWGGMLLSSAYLVVAGWYLRLAILGMHGDTVPHLTLIFASAALLLVPAALVIRWRRFLD